jgi:hypothetical protein
MYMLQRLVIDEIEIENMDGTISVFKDECWVRCCERNTKLETREWIEKNKEKYKDVTFRVIHPGGAVSNPMNIKLQGKTKKVNIKAIEAAKKDKYRIADDYEPIIVPKHPLGRMRLIARTMKENDELCSSKKQK